MYLTGPGPRALNRIEDALTRSDPHLAGIYAVFTRLTAGEEIPRIERIRPARRTLQAMLLVLVLVVATAAGRTARAGAALCRRCFRRSYRPGGQVTLGDVSRPAPG